MSAALVRKALEISAETEQVIPKKLKRKKDKIVKKKKKTAEEVQKRNLKILKALAYKPKSDQSSSAGQSKKKKKPEKTAFSDEDFKKFEEEYFVTE